MPDKRINLFNLLKDEGKLETIYVYAVQQVQLDPYEKNVERKFLNPLSIKGLVRDLSPESLHWKYFGQLDIGSKEIICEKKYKSLLLTAAKIKIDDNYYSVRKDSSQGWNILERQDYIIVIAALKNQEE